MCIRDIRMLIRDRVSLMVAVAAAFGYLLARPVSEPALAWTMVGTGLLVWACSAWNQMQERDVDALLPRTKNRPLPCGRISVRNAALFGALCFVAAVVCLYKAGGPTVALLACAVAGAYNGLYTPLKRVTGFALLVGALVGAMPPVLGWLCAGGAMNAPELWLLYGVYVLWQVPHFWLRAERDSAAYREAGLPLPPAQFAGPCYRRLLRLWFQAYAMAVLLLPVFPLLHSPAARTALALLGMILFVGGGLALGRERGTRSALRLADGGIAAVMLVLVADRLVVGL